MDIQVFRQNADLLIQLTGRIVLDETDRLKTNTVPLIDTTVSLVYLDLSRVEFMDSAGLGVLVGLKMTTNKAKARLVLVAPSKAVHDILYVSKLDSIFDILTGAEAEGVRIRLGTVANLQRSIGKDAGAGTPAAGPAGGASGGRISAPPAPGAFSIGSSAPGGGGAPQFSAPRPAPQPAFASPMAAPQPGFANQPSSAAGNRPAAAPAGADASSMRARIEAHCREAVEFMRQGDYDRAADCYQKAVDLDPNYLPAYNNLAIVYEKKPAWHQKAIEAWEKVYQLSSKNGDQKHMERASKHLNNLRKL